MPRRLFSAAAAGALLLGLAACGDTTDGPVIAPPPDLGIAAPSDGGGAPAPSDGGGEQADPSADAPDIPPPDPADYAGMDENTPEGAEQAFRYYIAVSMWATKLEKTPTTPLQSADCSGCSELNHDLLAKEHGDYWESLRLRQRDNSSRFPEIRPRGRLLSQYCLHVQTTTSQAESRRPRSNT